MPSLNLPNPFHHKVDRPSLKERAASLRASAARLLRRKPDPAEADQGRRMMVAGSMAAVAAVPLPALAGAALPVAGDGPHPDQAVLNAEAAFIAAREAERVAEAAFSTVHRAYSAALGDLPPGLKFPAWAIAATAHPGMPLWKYKIQRRMEADGFRWTAVGLRRAIASLPEAFSRAGRTPHMIRELRALVPIAETYEMRKAELEERFGCMAALDTLSEAREARRLAEVAVLEAVAVTPAGLAVKVRLVAACSWYDMGGRWGALLQSAAAVTGVELPQPDYDAANWVQTWESIGGRLIPTPPGSPLEVISPRSSTVEDKDEVRRLVNEFSANRYAIERFVQGRG